MSLRHGSIVEINLDSSSARATSLKAHVYDLVEKRFILSQTSPPIRPSQVEKTVYLSYIAKDGTPARRLGFAATIKGISRDYTLASGLCVPTLVVEMKSEPKQISLRKGYRVHPTRGSGISLSVGGTESEIVDISLAGLRFVQDFALNSFEPKHRLECLLKIDGRPFPVEVKVIRVSQVSLVKKHVAAAFVSLGKELQTVLSKKILMLEREQLSRGC